MPGYLNVMILQSRSERLQDDVKVTSHSTDVPSESISSARIPVLNESTFEAVAKEYDPLKLVRPANAKTT